MSVASEPGSTQRRVIDLGAGSFIYVDDITAILVDNTTSTRANCRYAIHSSIGGDFGVICYFRGSSDGVVLVDNLTPTAADMIAQDARLKIRFGTGDIPLENPVGR